MSAGFITASGTFHCADGELTEDEVEAAKRNFRAYDVDNDGFISRQDFKRAMQRYDPIWGVESKEAELDEMFAAVDLDGTGLVDFAKFAAMRVRKKIETEMASGNGSMASATKSGAAKDNPSFLDSINPLKLFRCLCVARRSTLSPRST